MNRKALASMALLAVACGAGRRPAAAPPSSAALRHPGILLDDARLDAVKAHLAAGQEPWTTAMAQLRQSRWASLDWEARPRAVVECGPYSKPSHGCSEERDDAVAAYTHALVFALSGDARHARKGIEILNAWSAVVTDHTLHNAPLQSAWAASIFPRAAEILRHRGAGWDAAEVARFETMLTRV